MKDIGVIVIPEFISELEEQEILSIVEQYPGKDRSKGPARMFRFGELKLTDNIKNDTLSKAHGYRRGRRSYGKMNDGIDVSIDKVPAILNSLGERLCNSGYLSKVPPIYVVNKYLKGQTIGRHIDHFDNGPTIPVIGLKSDAIMRLSKGDVSFDVKFPRRALFLLKDQARYEWFHEILPCKEERYALVFRNLPS